MKNEPDFVQAAQHGWTLGQPPKPCANSRTPADAEEVVFAPDEEADTLNFVMSDEAPVTDAQWDAAETLCINHQAVGLRMGSLFAVLMQSSSNVAVFVAREEMKRRLTQKHHDFVQTWQARARVITGAMAPVGATATGLAS